jgi:putative ABC transport system permease protein
MTLTATWLRGIFARRSGRLLAAALGVAATVALLASLGIFINGSAESMTRRALGDVPVDWQVQLVPGANPDAVTQALGASAPYTTLERIGYADVAGFNALSGGTTQTTGAGKVLGVSDTYWRSFPLQLRALLGHPSGVLIAQQAAANLHAGIGDAVTIMRPGLPAATVRIDGVIDLPNADSLFQAVGVPPGAAPQAPPDNVLVLPLPLWHHLFDPQAAVRPDSVRLQLHVRLRHNLPPDPRDAFVSVQQRAHNFEARIAGSGVVGDNLAARLDSVREDALYARILFLFLGVPGALLAILLTIAVAASGTTRRRREQALLRIRGASAATVLRLESLETLVIGIGGVLAGLGAAWLIALWMSPGAPPTLPRAGFSIVVAALIGLLTAAGAVIVPAWRELRQGTVVEARAFVGRGTKPLWERTGLDFILLILAGVIYWRTAATGYKLVLAAEGVAQTSVSYEAFIAPLCLWLGVGLLVTRVMRGALASWRGALARILRPLAGALSPAVAASIARQRNVVTRGVVLVALAFSFAVSTAVFNTTYNAQSRIDAELTNGADVSVTGSTPYPAGAKLDAVRRTPGVTAAEPMIHRFAYVGNDLQDIYGIEPGRIGNATSLSDAYFSKITAKAAMAALAGRNDGVFVSQETVNDFQLKIGDLINLRLQNVGDHQYHVVPFHLLGIVREFPTAPKDSFLITNASYIASVTGSDAREIVLIRSAIAPASLAQRIAQVVAGLPGARVTDIGSVQRTISSSLTAVDLHGLTLLELTFAVLLIAGAAGLVLGLGLVERRRDFALLAAIGASARQIGAFVWAEALLVIVCGSVIGTATGFGLAQILVKLLTGVFDPAPEHLVVPWSYLITLFVAGALSVIAAVVTVARVARRHTLDALRTI